MKQFIIRTEREGDKKEVDRVYVNLNDTRFTITVDHENKMVINKQDLSGIDDTICINPSVSNVIRIT